MSREVAFELHVFLVFALHGSLVLLGNDLLRAWRLAVPHKAVWTGVEDTFFWLGAGIWTFILIFVYQDGILRLYMAAAMGIGGVLYRKSLSPLVIRQTAGLLCAVGNIFRKIAKKKDKISQKTVAKFVKKE